jgi:Rhodopirellula transposase DDE domain
MMRYVAVADADEAALAGKFAVMRPFLDERGWRVYLGTEANALGYGGVAAVARASGASETTVAAGAAEAADPAVRAVLPPGRSRRAGAGRPRSEDAQPGLTDALNGLLEDGKRGDPVSPLTWSVLSLRDLEQRMAALGFRCGKDAVARLMHQDGWSLRGMAKVLEGSQHPDRDAQFRRISAMIAEFTAAGEPAVSVDGKKKEQLGPYHRDGRSWRPAGDPVRVRDHDFPDPELGRIAPYGVYDIAANRGFVSVGTSHDTAAFAVNAIRRWWQAEGQSRYPRAARLLLTCDSGGSNSSVSRLWKHELALLAAETGLEVTVCHFPPGTSKWNRIEHRLFCHITRTWKARPLMTTQDAVAGIAATATYQGLKCTAVLDGGSYPDKVKISDNRMKYLEDRVLDRDPFHGEWNYTIAPAPRPGPEPGPERPGPDPALPAALAALAGVPDLHERAGHAWQADREHRLALARGRPRLKNSGGNRLLAPETVLAAAACRLRLGMTWALLAQVLGVHHSSISVPGGHAVILLGQLGITPEPGQPRIKTAAALRDHATALGITIPAITRHEQAGPHAPHPDDTPETAN